MFEKTGSSSVEYLKSLLGLRGTVILKEKGIKLENEIEKIFEKVKEIASY